MVLVLNMRHNVLLDTFKKNFQGAEKAASIHGIEMVWDGLIRPHLHTMSKLLFGLLKFVFEHFISIIIYVLCSF